MTRNPARNPPTSIRSVLIGTLASAILLGTIPSLAPAQDSPERRRELIEELLKSLIEAELQKKPAHTVRKISASSSSPPIRTATSTADLTTARELLDQFSEESSRLAFSLDADNSRIPEIRANLTDALKLRARSAVLAQKSRLSTDIQAIAADFASVDQDWRALSHSLKSVRGLNAESLRSAAALSTHDRKLCELLNVRPQLDRRELIRQTETLSSDLRNLVEDIEIELGRVDDSQAYLIGGRKAQQQAIQMANAVSESGDYDRIVSEYKQFQQLYYPLATNLQTIENRYLERSMRRVQHADQLLNELLWLDQDLNRPQLLHATERLKKDVDEFFARTPLKLLISLPDSYSVLTTADEFYGVCSNLADVVSRGEDQESIIDAYRYVDNSGALFLESFRPLRSQAAQSVLKDIESGLVSIRESLSVSRGSGGVDRRKAIELASSLELLADHLDLDTNRWLTRTPETFRSDALKATAGFARDLHDLHEDLLSGAKTTALRLKVAALYDSWRTVYSYVSRCQTEDRARLARTASSITPKLVDLNALLEL